MKDCKRKLDTVLSIRMDRRDLATLSKIIDANGYLPMSKSNMVRLALESLVSNYVNSGRAKFVETTEEAVLLLKRRFPNLNPSGKGQKNLTFNLEQDCREAELDPDHEEMTKIADDWAAKYKAKEEAKKRELQEMPNPTMEEEEKDVSFEDV